jgi:hypothetical protein
MDYNDLFEYIDGDLYWIVKPCRNMPIGMKAGTLRKDGYIGIYVDKKYIFAHRAIWEMRNGAIPAGLVIDHIDGNRSNNRIDNLRVCTFQQNHFNRKPRPDNKSGFRGVSWHKQKQKWVAQITIDKKSKFLGFFTNPEEAYAAYCEMAIEHFGEYARLD